MIIDSINLNNLRIFEFVYKTRSMTKAANELHLTQSGVSQHIKTLEFMLNIKLFDRIKHLLVPTANGTILYNQCTQSLYNIEKVLLDLKGAIGELSGTVHIGMSVEFGRNVILPLLCDFAHTHPKIKFNIKFGGAYLMSDLILKGEIDFAFIDEFSVDERIKTEIVYNEVLNLYVLNNRNKKKYGTKMSKEFFEKLDYIDYVEDASLLKKWFKYHLNASDIKLNLRAIVFDVRAVARLILLGLGAGILPSHRVSILGEEAKNLYCFRVNNKKLTNKISIAYIKDRSHTPATSTLLDFLKAKLRTH